MGKKGGRPKNPKTPPWKRAHQERNPTISMASTSARRQVLDQIRSARNMSIGQIFDEFMSGKLDAGVEMLRQIDGLKATIKTKNDLIDVQDNTINRTRRDITDIQTRSKQFLVGFPCEVCGNDILLRADSQLLKEIEDFIKENWDWKHDKCPLALKQ